MLPLAAILILSVDVFAKTLLIGIFSAPENFHKRLSIRRSWIKLIASKSNVQYFFVVGNKMCPIAPGFRKSYYGCDAPNPFFDRSIESSVESNFNSGKTSTGFNFRAEREIVITELGIPKCVAAQLESPVRVKLLDSYDNKLLTSITIGQNNEENQKAIKQMAFPKMSEGKIILEFANPKDEVFCKCTTLAWNDRGAISFGGMVRDGGTFLFDKTWRPCVFFVYTIIEPTNTHLFDKYQLEWSERITEVYNNIEEEEKQFNDILLVNVSDYYDNLPNKLVKFFKIVNDVEFNFLMKTDDDSFVDVLRVMSELRSVATENMWWWSSFREYYNVPLAGKWREEIYRSATYPPFPCGGGYVISRQVVNYLSTVSENLVTFKGEDISIGIWLAGMKVERHEPSAGNSPTYEAVMRGFSEDPCQWICDHSEKKSYCNLVQLTVDDMYHVWEQYKTKTKLINNYFKS